MGKLIQNAGCYDYLNTGDTAIPSGGAVVNNGLFGFAIREIPAGGLGAVQVDGIWEIEIGSAETASIGDAAYWDAVNSKATATASTNLFIGSFVKAKANAETTCQVMLNVGAGAASASGSGSGE